MSKQTLKLTPSIAYYEQTIKQLKYTTPRTKQLKSEINLQQSELNKHYATNKKYIMEFEKTNYQYLALMRSTNNFYKLFSHSALFYTCSLAPKLNISARLQEDRDYTAKSPEGFVSIRHSEKHTELFATLGIKPVATKNQTGDFIIYKLPWTFTEKQLKEFNEQNLTNLQKFNQIVIVDNSIPVLFVEIEELLKAVYENVRGMNNPVEKQTFGHQIITATSTMACLYLDLSNGNIDKLNSLKQMKQNLMTVKYHTKLLTDLKIWQPKTCARIGEIIIKVQDIIERELKNI